MEEREERNLGLTKDTNEPGGFKVGAATWKMLACVATKKKLRVSACMEMGRLPLVFLPGLRESAILFQAGEMLPSLAL